MAVLNQLLSNGCASAGTIGGPSPTTTTIILRAEIPALGLRKAIRVHRMDVPRVIVGQILDKANLEGAQFVGWRLYRVGVRAVDADAVSVPAASVPVAAATTLTSSTATATATTTVIPVHDDLLQQQRHARDEQQHVERPSGTWLDDEVPLAEQSHGRAWRDHDIVQLLPSSEGHIVGPPVRVASAAHSSALHSSTAHSSTAHSSAAHSSAAHPSTGSSAARPSTGGGATHSSSATSTQSTGIYSPRITPSASIAVQPHNTAPPASIIKKFGKIAAKSSTIVSKKINKARETTKGKLSTFSSSTTFAHGKTFGMPLDVVPCDTHGVPLVIEMALQHLRARDMRTEGLFRLSGAASAVQALKDAFDRDGAVDGKAAMDACLDGHAVAGLVKLFLREMPEPLLTFELYDAWIAAQGRRKSWCANMCVRGIHSHSSHMDYATEPSSLLGSTTSHLLSFPVDPRASKVALPSSPTALSLLPRTRR